MPPRGSVPGLMSFSASSRAHDEDARVAAGLEVPPLGDELEVGERLRGADHADRLPGAVRLPVLPGPGVGVAVDVGEVLLAERLPARPRPVDEGPGGPGGLLLLGDREGRGDRQQPGDPDQDSWKRCDSHACGLSVEEALLFRPGRAGLGLFEVVTRPGHPGDSPHLTAKGGRGSGGEGKIRGVGAGRAAAPFQARGAPANRFRTASATPTIRQTRPAKPQRAALPAGSPRKRNRDASARRRSSRRRSAPTARPPGARQDGREATRLVFDLARVGLRHAEPPRR